jgi:uncharacterized protein
MRMIAGTLLTGLAMYALACLAIYLTQRSLIYFPQPRRAGAGTPVMTLQVKDARLEVSTRPAAGPRAVIYFGGNAEDVSGSLPQLAAAFPDHALYLLHYRGYGASTGSPSEQALVADGLALFDHVRGQHANVTVIGRSLGSGVAVHLAGERPVARLVLVTPYDSIAGIAARQFPWFPTSVLLADRFESFRYAPKVTAPTTVITAEHDTLIPAWSSDKLLTRFAPGVARHVVIPSSGHNDLSDSAAYAAALSGR